MTKPSPLASCFGCLLMCGLIFGGCGLFVSYLPDNATSGAAVDDTPVALANTAPAIEQPQAPAPSRVQPLRKPIDPNAPRSTPAGRQFISFMLADLDKFAKTEDFAVYGFGTGGRYNAWLVEMESIEGRPEYQSFTLFERIAIGDLRGLGMAYVFNRGAEDKYTIFARNEILKVITDSPAAQ